MDDLASELAELPAQPAGVEWPIGAWPEGSPDPAVDAVVEQAFGDPEIAETYAVVVAIGGRVVAERYGGALPSFTHAPTPVDEATPLLSWSMAKSFLHAAVGVLVGDGRLDPDAPAPVPEWRRPGDPRGAITLRQLLQMRDGLRWNEDYVRAEGSDVIEMLFGAGKDDVAAYAASKPLSAVPGTTYNYSSGTSNLVARCVGQLVGPGAATEAFLKQRLFDPLGMQGARVSLDAAGTFIGSSYLYCSARAMAKFATLYLRDGVFGGERLLPQGWVDGARRAVSVDRDEEDLHYSEHWWLDSTGAFWASGYEGQRAIVVPDADAVIVRYGRTPEAASSAVRAWSDAACAAVRSAASSRP